METRGTKLGGLVPSAALVVAIVLIGAMTLPGAPDAAAAAARTPWWCVTCGSIGTADVIQNIALFFPLGVALASVGARRNYAIALFLALSISVEALQALAIVGRDATLGDVLANSAGGVLGWTVATRRRQILTPRRAGALGGMAAVGAAFAVVAAMAGGLLQPALSRAEYTRARLAPDVEGRPRFAGVVLRFSLGGVSYADRDVPASLPAAGIDAGATVIWPGRVRRAATIARIDGRSGDAAFSIDQREGGIRVHAFSRASSWRLRSPTVDVPMPPGTVAGDTVAIQFNWQGNDVVLIASSSRGRTQTAGRYRVADGWMLFNPFTGGVRFDSHRTLWTTLWLAAWGAVIGWYAWRAARRPYVPGAAVVGR